MRSRCSNGGTKGRVPSHDTADRSARRSEAGAPQPKTTALQFAEVRLPRPLPAAALPLEVRLPDGTVLRGTHAAELAALARALRG